jgi:type III pantothenate kinase
VEWFILQEQLAGIINQYRNPTQLGSDRFAAAIGARALFPNRALIIATCGTALTIDAVTVKGEFIGGMIVPGLRLLAESLTCNTAQLPSISEHHAIPAHFANHTEAAILSGCLAAQAGAIEYAVREFSAANPLCVVSGGAANYIMPSLKTPHQFVDNLVLIGLQVAAC